MTTVLNFLSRTQGDKRLARADVLTYLYLTLSTLIMFGPIVWLILSSFKPQNQLIQFPPTLLPYRSETVMVEGYDAPLELYNVTMEDGTVQKLAQVRRVGSVAEIVYPTNPGEIIPFNIN